MPLDTCPSCGTMAPLLADRCKFCGARFERDQSPPNPDPIAFGRPASPGDIQTARTNAGVARVVRRTAIACAVALIAGFTFLYFASRGGDGLNSRETEAIEATGDWVAYTDPDRAFSIDFPGEPTAGEIHTDAQWRAQTTSGGVGQVVAQIEYADYFTGFTGGVQGEEFLNAQPDYTAQTQGGKVRFARRVSVSGLAAIEFVVDGGDGRVWHETAVLTGRRMYWIEVGAPGVDPAKAHTRFVQSFRALDPNKR